MTKSVKAFISLCAGAFVLGHSSPPAQAQSGPNTGVYRITPRVRLDLCLDVQGWRNANGTTISLQNANHSSNQQWRVEAQSDGAYKIYAYSGRNSLQMLDDTNGGVNNGNPVTTYEDKNAFSQRWYIQPVGGGFWRLVPASAGPGSSQTLEVVGATPGVGSRLNVWADAGADSQAFRFDDPGTPRLLYSKKGLGGHESDAGALGASWCYNWSTTLPSHLAAGVEFVPMQWGYWGGNISSQLNAAKTADKARRFLAFNEPDGADQANLTVSNALTGYQYLAGLGLPIISPACVHADDQWMKDFMAGASTRGLRVDAVAVHWYGWTDAAGFLAYIDSIHALYGKNVWITEFAPADWSGARRISPQQEADFMRAVLPVLNQRAYVIHYAWFGAASPGDAALGAAALWNTDGTHTALGDLYSRM